MAQKKKVLQKTSKSQSIVKILRAPFITIRRATNRYLARRPHRSFRMTRRRDYARSLKLPGYFAFTNSVFAILWKNRKLFILLVVTYIVLTALLVGVASQSSYSAIADSLNQAGNNILGGNLAGLANAFVLFGVSVSGGLSQTLSEAQSVYAVIIALMTWLTTVWLLRNVMAGHKVKLRDGLYNASAPILSTFIVGFVLILQLLPLAIALIAYSAASVSGILSGGVEAMLFWIVASLLVILSVYWITSTLIALVIVTLPGIYPMRAIRTAGDLVVGRRIRILLRMVWLSLSMIIAWIVVMIPIILLDNWLKDMWTAIELVPTIPAMLLIMSALSIVWSSSYIYLLYRKVVEDDADPA